MITLICKKKDVDSGKFTIDQLKMFTQKFNSVVIIRSTAKIEKGEIDYFN